LSAFQASPGWVRSRAWKDPFAVEQLQELTFPVAERRDGLHQFAGLRDKGIGPGREFGPGWANVGPEHWNELLVDVLGRRRHAVQADIPPVVPIHASVGHEGDPEMTRIEPRAPQELHDRPGMGVWRR